MYVNNIFTGRGRDYFSSELFNIRFPAGMTNVSFSITIRNDGYFEGDEVFHLIMMITTDKLLPNNVTYGSYVNATVVIENADSKQTHIISYVIDFRNLYQNHSTITLIIRMCSCIQ